MSSLLSPAARLVEHLLGLDWYSLCAVERRASGHFALRFRRQRVGRRYLRVLRLPQRHVFGYQQRSVYARSG